MKKLSIIALTGVMLVAAPNASAWDMSLNELSKVLKNGDFTAAEIARLVASCDKDPDCNIVPAAPPGDEGKGKIDIRNYSHALKLNSVQKHSTPMTISPNQRSRVIPQHRLKSGVAKPKSSIVKKAPCPGPMCPDEI